jgi:hypothetical protein
LASDLAKFERRVAAAVKRALRQHEFDALVSFDFNTGAIASGTVDDKLARGDIEAALATCSNTTRPLAENSQVSTGGATVKRPCSATAHTRRPLDQGLRHLARQAAACARVIASISQPLQAPRCGGQHADPCQATRAAGSFH